MRQKTKELDKTELRNYRSYGSYNTFRVVRYSYKLKMASPRFAAVEGPLARVSVLIVPVWGQKVKGISPSPFEVLIRSREQEPARTTDRTAITARFGHDVNARL